MSAKKPTARAARSPRSTAPKAGRPWYAPRPRWYVIADGIEAQLMRRERTPYNVKPIARCDSLHQAKWLAAALNREERAREQAEVLRYECALRRDVLFGLVEDLHLPRFRRPPAIRECVWDQVERLLEEGERARPSEPTFAPGGEVRGLKPAAQDRPRDAGGEKVRHG